MQKVNSPSGAQGANAVDYMRDVGELFEKPGTEEPTLTLHPGKRARVKSLSKNPDIGDSVY